MKKKVIIWLLVLFLDFLLYIFLGLVLLNYEDFYDESKRKYWSLESMTFLEKIAYIAWYFWFFINIILVIYLLYRFFKKYIFKRF